MGGSYPWSAFRRLVKRPNGKVGCHESLSVAATVRRALRDVVENGTGDHRHVRYGAGRQLIESRVVNRTATFVFFIGERFFGTITAHVPGPEAAEYRFTSGLPVQLLKVLAPSLQPLLTTPAPTTVSALQHHLR